MQQPQRVRPRIGVVFVFGPGGEIENGFCAPSCFPGHILESHGEVLVLVKLSVVVKLSGRTLGDLVSLLLRLPAYSGGLKVSLQWFPHFARPPPSSLHYCSTAARLPVH